MAEQLVARLQHDARVEDIIALFYCLDDLADACRGFGDAGVDLGPELTRIETVHNILRNRGSSVVRSLSRHRRLETLRAEADLPTDHWWWYLDRHVAEQRTRRKRRLLRRFAMGAALLALLVAAYMLFPRPDEVTRIRLDYTSRADTSVEAGDYADALACYQQALELAPDDPEINLMVGVMFEALDRPQDAETQYAEAARLYGATADLSSARSQKYTLLGWYDQAEADAQAAIALDDQLAMGYLALGSAYEAQGRDYEAMGALERAAELATIQEQDDLYVIVKMRLGMLMQKAAVPEIEVIEQPSG
jgi:tetratricopeptide (TPR) repeat protein